MPNSNDQAFDKLKRGIKQIFGPKEYRLYKKLEGFQTLQVCKDLSLTGELDERLIATCRLGEFGYEALDGLEIAILDENDLVRSLSVVMTALIAGKAKEKELKPFLKDESPRVKAAAQFAVNWLENADVKIPAARENNGPDLESLIIHDDEVPLRTSDTVFIKNDYSTGVNTVEFEVTVDNEGKEKISNVEVRLLGYPAESLNPPEKTRITIDSINGMKSKSVSFTFKVKQECVEGEMITSVVFNEGTGERVSAKAGNCFVRSFYDWITPIKTSKKDGENLRKQLKHWGREHEVTRDPEELHEMFMKTFEAKNLYIYHKDKDEKSKVFMSSIYGIGRGDFTHVDVIASILIVGDKKEKVSKVRMDVYSSDSEILHTAASELYETTLSLLGEI